MNLIASKVLRQAVVPDDNIYRLLDHLVWKMHHDQWSVGASMTDIARGLARSRRTAQRVVTRAEEGGWVTRQRTGRRSLWSLGPAVCNDAHVHSEVTPVVHSEVTSGVHQEESFRDSYRDKKGDSTRSERSTSSPSPSQSSGSDSERVGLSSGLDLDRALGALSPAARQRLMEGAGRHTNGSSP